MNIFEKLHNEIKSEKILDALKTIEQMLQMVATDSDNHLQLINSIGNYLTDTVVPHISAVEEVKEVKPAKAVKAKETTVNVQQSSHTTGTDNE